MWLINTTTLRLEEVLSPEKEQYAILSHTWEAAREVSFDEFADINKAKRKPGYAKIATTCEIARSQGLKYAWVDTCCIDKRSSAELTEAINSMFKWYRGSHVCYAFIADLPPLRNKSTDRDEWLSGKRSYRWFSRGWTLQELIAPKNIHFYDREWHPRGTKTTLAEEIARVTGIDDFILKDPKHLSSVPVARRMSWASNRQTTRVEDMAYCLLGIFNVNMPMIYGEGNRAFLRLQEEIAKMTNDLSLFAWTRRDTANDISGLLAISPSEFAHCRDLLRYRDFLNPSSEFAMTNRGVRIEAYTWLKDQVLSLQCALSQTSDDWKWIGIYIYKTPSGFIRLRPRDLFLSGEAYFTMLDNEMGKKTLTIPKLLDEIDHQRILIELSGRIYIRQEIDKRYSSKTISLAPEILWNPQEGYFLTMEESFASVNDDAELYPTFHAFRVFDIFNASDVVCRCILICGYSRSKKSSGRPFAAVYTDQDTEHSNGQSNLDSSRDIIESALTMQPSNGQSAFLDRLWKFVRRRSSDPSGNDLDWPSLDNHSVRVKGRFGRQVSIGCRITAADANEVRLDDGRVRVTLESNLGSKYVITISVREAL